MPGVTNEVPNATSEWHKTPAMSHEELVLLQLELWPKIHKTRSCWFWTGSLDARGYGVLYIKGVTIRAHRFYFELANGPIPDGLFVCHHCDNPSCVRPLHLFAGTALDNVRDMIQKGRNNPRRGEAHRFAKLTEADVRGIRAALAEGQRMSSVARQFGVKPGAIQKIRDGESWKHVG